jgi:basic amino acid/polyamine antiporter, APA family
MTQELRRTLGTVDLTFLVVGSVIGSGIFLVPSAVLAGTGSVPSALAVWIAGGVLSFFGALSYAELGSMDASSGGLYAYIRDAFGRFPAFLFGWTLFLVIGSGSIATLAVAAANYMGQFAELAPWHRKAIATALIIIIAVLNVRSVRQSASVVDVATAIKVAAILAMSAALFALGDPPVQNGGALVPPASFFASVGAAMIAVLWAYEGWQYVTYSAGEAKDPQRSLPRAIALGTLILVAIYLTANLAYLAALGPERMAASERVAGEATAAVLGPRAGQVIALAIIISMYSAAHSIVLTAPRVYYSMARDGLFFRRLAEVHPRFGTPALAIVTSAAWACLLAITGTFEQLLTYVVFVGWIFYALGAAAVMVLRRKRPDTPRPFRVPGYPFTPVLFVIAAAAIVLNTIATQPARAAIGLGVVFLGAPAYALWRRRGG